MQMLELMQHVGVAIAAGASLVATIVLRVATQRRDVRRGLHSVIFFLVVFLGARAALLFIPGWNLIEPDGQPTMTAKVIGAVMLAALAFSVLRFFPLIFFDYLAHRRGRATIPRIIRDVIVAAIYIVVGLTIIASVFPGVNLSSLVAGAGVLSLVLGLALQDTLGNVFAGLALQAERPFEPGDWITVGTTTGRVTEIDWRATKVVNWDEDILVIPNSVIGRAELVNHSRPVRVTGCKITVNISYDTPPNEIVDTLLGVLGRTPGVLVEPEPWCRLVEFSDNHATYMLRFFAPGLVERYKLEHRVRLNVWYALRRAGVQIQIPIRTIRQLPPDPPALPGAVTESLVVELEAIEFLRGIDSDALRSFAAECHRDTYGAGEAIIREGDAGTDCFLVLGGTLKVTVANGRQDTVLATLGPGDHFGEMSALSGDPRSSTVVADTDVDLVVVGGRPLKELLQHHPEAADRLGDVLEHRREEITRLGDAAGASKGGPIERGQILQRLRRLLGLG